MEVRRRVIVEEHRDHDSEKRLIVGNDVDDPACSGGFATRA